MARLDCYLSPCVDIPDDVQTMKASVHSMNTWDCYVESLSPDELPPAVFRATKRTLTPVIMAMK